MRFASAASVAALALAGCGSSHPLGADIVHAVKAVQTIHDDERLRAELRRTRQRLARDGAKTPAERKAKALALRGVAVTLRGVEGRIAFTKNDSGNVEAATRDAERAHDGLRRGPLLLVEAAREAGARIPPVSR